jgi:hypothetical protein
MLLSYMANLVRSDEIEKEEKKERRKRTLEQDKKTNQRLINLQIADRENSLIFYHKEESTALSDVAHIRR